MLELEPGTGQNPERDLVINSFASESSSEFENTKLDDKHLEIDKINKKNR